MQQESNHPTQLFKQVLASGTTLTDEHNDQLQILLYSFPQSGLLHAIQARLGSAAQLKEAAAWFGDSALLQKVVLSSATLRQVSAGQVVIKDRPLKLEPEPELVVAEAELAAEPEMETYYAIADDEEPQDNYVDQAEQPAEKPFTRPIFKEEPLDDTQKLVIENLAANDYFVFDKAFADRNKMQLPAAEPTQPEVEMPVSPKPTVTEIKKASQPAAEEGGVTRYHDDKMPYSFSWWLDKTRNKHSGVYQPFANPAPPVSIQPEPEPAKEVFEEREREDTIVERFMQEEQPMMKPPSADKLDSENKARQSVTDHEELITETLARIYADQMLYSKAIAAYKILMLKNPEKRRYFASHIENLEKKIN